MFIILLTIYYQLFLKENLGRDFDIFKDHLFQISEEATARIKSCYPNQERITAHLAKIADRKNVKITVYDVDGNKICGVDRRKGYGLNLELKSFTVVGRNVIYIVELVYPFSIENLGELNSIRKIRDAALIFMLLLIILLIIYLHFSLIRPLSLLNQGLESVDYRSGGVPEALVKNRRRDELGDLAKKFQAMQQRLNASYRQQTEMIASISHDLKTPLTSIIGFLERLTSRKISAEREEEYHRIIYQKATDIQELISEFNDFVTSDFDDNSGNKTVVSLKDFFSEISVEYSAELAAKGVKFDSVSEAKDGLFLEIDLQKIRRVFANLVNNSLKHAEGLTKITFKCLVRKNEALFMLEDDGPGVPAAELKAIFDRFYRVEKSRSREKGGSGLGLAICQRIIVNHGGAIQAYLPKDRGFGVSFSLPLQKHS
ncbi:MAG: sensor histidine kinase [Bacillota bacterium]